MPDIITTSGNGYFPKIDISEIAKAVINGKIKSEGLSIEEVRKRLYDNISPYGYAESASRFLKAIEQPPSNEWNFWKNSSVRDRIFAKYLNIPKDQLHDHWTIVDIEKSPYSPTIGEHHDYYRVKPNEFAPEVIDDFVHEASNLPINSNKNSGVFSPYFGTHTIGKGFDDKGTYVSYYDLWDLDPLGLGKDILLELGIGTPTHYYDRIYLDDYYKLDDAVRGTLYLPDTRIIYDVKKHKKVNNKTQHEDPDTSREAYENNRESSI